MRALAIIDSFKGTLTSKQLGQLTVEAFNNEGISADYVAIADGGEGFIDAITNETYSNVSLTVMDPLMRPIECSYLIDEINSTAYIEMARSSGLCLLQNSELSPGAASTFGLGEQIKDAILREVKNIIIGVGGSATNDGGAGMLEALGVKFFDIDDNQIHIINNEKLAIVKRIESDLLDELIKDINFTVLTDVDNPLLGIKGATYVYSKQKGAKTLEQQYILERNLVNFSQVVNNDGDFPGAGAAGGVGYALQVFCHAKFCLGLHYILDKIDFEKIIRNYDYVITGEGKVDQQSLYGKVVFEIISRVKNVNSNIKTIIASAITEIEADNIFSIVPNFASMEESLNNPAQSYKKMINEIVIMIKENKI